MEVSDRDLVERLHLRDETALAVLYDRYARPAYSLACRIIGDHALAEDVLQEVFLTLWNRPGVYLPERGRFLPWLLGVTHHRSIDVVRGRGAERKRQVGDDQRDLLLDLVADHRTHSDPADRVAVELEVEAVRQEIAGLPVEQREALALSLLGGLSHGEIARRLGQPLGTIKTRLRLALRKVRDGLATRGLAGNTP